MAALPENAGAPGAAELLELALWRRGEGVLFAGAHPDDESFALGGHLYRLPLALVLITTDGAPRCMKDGRELGFVTAADYAAARRRELIAALAEATISPDRLTMLDIPDQEAVNAIGEIATRIQAMVAERGIWLVLTHAYEGGHPDHDAAACAVQAACTRLRRAGIPAPSVVEMPYYRAAAGAVAREFAAPDGVFRVELDATGFARKRAMMARHETQQRLLVGLVSPIEQFRVAPAHRFDQAPNEGRLLYEAWGLGVTGEAWLCAATRALEQLGVTP